MNQLTSININQIAHILRSKLEKEGINCLSEDDLDNFESYVKKLLKDNFGEIQKQTEKERIDKSVEKQDSSI